MFVCILRYLFVCLFGFLTSSSTTRLYRGRAPRQSVWEFTCCHTWDRAGRPWLLSQPAFCDKLTCQVACWRKDWTHCRSGSHALTKTCSHNTKKVSLLQYYTITINRKRTEVIKQRTDSSGKETDTDTMRIHCWPLPHLCYKWSLKLQLQTLLVSSVIPFIQIFAVISSEL